MLLLSSVAYSQALQGTYLTEEYNTQFGEDSVRVTYTFVGDSLYIDTYPSGCPVASMEIKYVTNDYVAVETIYNIENPNDAAYIRVYHLEFLPCAWNKRCFAVYRDGKVVDIIRKIP